MSAAATFASSALNRGKSASIVRRPLGVSDTRTIRPSSAAFFRRTNRRRWSVESTPVAVGRLMPTAAANSLDSISPQIHRTQRAVNAVHERRSGASTVASRWRRSAVELRKTFEIAHIARKSSGR